MPRLLLMDTGRSYSGATIICHTIKLRKNPLAILIDVYMNDSYLLIKGAEAPFNSEITI